MANVLEARRRAKLVRDLVTARLEKELTGYHVEIRDEYTEWALAPTPKRTIRLKALMAERIRDMCEKIAQTGDTPPPLPAEDADVPALIGAMLGCETKYVGACARHKAGKYYSYVAGWDPN